MGTAVSPLSKSSGPIAVDSQATQSGSVQGNTDPVILNSGVTDPSAGAGIAAPLASICLYNDAGVGELWVKTGAAATAWTQATNIAGNITPTGIDTTGTADFDWDLDAASATALSFDAGGVSQLGIDTVTNTVFVGAANGFRLNDNSELRFGTPGTDLVFTPNGTDVVVTGTGDLNIADGVGFTFGTGVDVTLTGDGTDLNIGQGAGAGDVTFLDGIDVNFGTTKDLIVSTAGGNVTFSNTGAALALWHDDVFIVADPADTTKRTRIDSGSVTAGQTRVLTMDDANVSLILTPGNQVIADPGDKAAIPVTRSGTIAITTAGVETNTLAIPTAVGQKLCISHDVDGGSREITVASAINEAGKTKITLTDAGESVILTAMQVAGALSWRITSNDGATLA